MYFVIMLRNWSRDYIIVGTVQLEAMRMNFAMEVMKVYNTTYA